MSQVTGTDSRARTDRAIGVPQDAPEIVERALALSRADACVVIASESSTVNLRWATNSLTTNGSSRDRSITVISVIDRSFGVRTASTIDSPRRADPATAAPHPTDADGLADLVRAAEAAALEAADAEDFADLLGPATAGGLATDVAFTDPAVRTGTAVFTDFARDLAEAFGAARAEGRRLFGFAEHDVTTTWLGTSTGLRLRHAQPTGSVEWNAKSGVPGGSVWHGQSTRDFTDVDVATTDAALRSRLAWCERSVELPAGRYETLLPPSAVADLMINLYWSAAGRDAAEGRTVFSRAGGGTRIGEAIGPAGLRLSSDPADPELATAPFVTAAASSAMSSVFDNGLALGATDWIRDGALAALVQTRATARATDSAVTPMIENLILDGGGTASLDEMIASTRRGLLLTSLWYIRDVDPETLLLTGLTRDGVYLVDNGEVAGAVNNFRFNESPVDLLGRIGEIGATTRTMAREWADWFTLTRMPPMRVPDLNMSSVSPAN
ncbi:putative Zn-dependent protease-like protein [Frankia canadensis]|uniref:Putative Zn-dependent protease-like protein n=1 Tax=Frankia canadensis TaxID=1836972 RepID=A0A2I2KMP4_9ACTN|nr:metallopeptidase TldD-related protein [Frankia canadensis]SNQ46934.1 putative Zn-dependent protease-like protein [Frankia canadensis]SOU54224.1 putative Zn-dependent protease-like protein [Frankia canadensis]